MDDLPSEYQKSLELPASAGKPYAVPSSDETGALSESFLRQIADACPVSPMITNMVLIDLAEHCLELRAEVLALDERFKELTTPELVALEAGKLAQGTNLRLRSKLTVLVAATLGSYLKAPGAENFVTMELNSPDDEVGGFVVTVQRKFGKSPAEMLKIKDARIAELEQEIADIYTHAR